MSIVPIKLVRWLEDHPKTKQWVWFVVLWCGGLATVMTMAYGIRLLMRI